MLAASLLRDQPTALEDRTYVFTSRYLLEPAHSPQELMSCDNGEPLLEKHGFQPNHNSTVWEKRVSDGGLDQYLIRVTFYPFSDIAHTGGPRFEAAVINPLIRNEDGTESERHMESVNAHLGALFGVACVISKEQEPVKELLAQF